MIEYIIGKVIDLNQQQIVIENNKQGFVYNLIKPINIEKNKLENLKLFTCEITNEFINECYACENKEIRDWFKSLLQIKTVGPKTALLILNILELDELKTIVRNNDLDSLLKIKGVGSFTAKIIISELNKIYFAKKMTLRQEKVITSLIKLGFKSKDIYQALQEIDSNCDLETMTKLTLERVSNNAITRL
ncbi:Holliday junction DNA helicase RuvA [Williamsoniiplasma somnilux]|uniref:Holliday junction branch migration complex subunit RuvA n=1 Tax=Williamsoniiplasma somnilux TaxID=215578 RepID=A0A2K8P160_9MOLU|nr:Holliday junction branch migration protein RuvA [Williamsoniiplasma somnilux]ATZ18741.1 Holliday junction DNA helicase RuvA [Williamsoniiplasma somnilux]